MLFSVLLSSVLVTISLQSPLQQSTSSLRLALKQNFPDPSFIEVDGIYYAFATNNGKQNVPMAKSRDFHEWDILEDQDAMPTVPNWSGGEIWAPDVVQLADDSFIMYFSATSLKDESKHVIGAATSKHVTGPYTPMNEPFASPLKEGGAIDPAGFEDFDGNRFVTYKIDGNSLGGGGLCGNADFSHHTPIMLQQVSKKDGITMVGHAHEILDRGPWDGPLNEAPSLIRTVEGVHMLFFSSNCYNGPHYDISYATSTTGVHGPYTKSSKPLLVTGNAGGRMQSPGGAGVGPGGKMMVFHNDKEPANATIRQMWAGELSIEGTTVTIA